jgi:hypothetical protein
MGGVPGIKGRTVEEYFARGMLALHEVFSRWGECEVNLANEAHAVPHSFRFSPKYLIYKSLRRSLAMNATMAVGRIETIKPAPVHLRFRISTE